MSTEYESERDRLATIYDLRLAFADEAIKTEKKNFTLEEVLDFFDRTAKSIKRHK